MNIIKATGNGEKFETSKNRKVETTRANEQTYRRLPLVILSASEESPETRPTGSEKITADDADFRRFC